MASCDDDFSLLGEDQTNPNHHHHHHHVLHQTYATHRFNSKPTAIHAPPPPLTSKDLSDQQEEDDDEGGEDDVVVDTASAFHGVNPFSADATSDPFENNGADPNRSMIVDTRTGKRQNQEELSDGGTGTEAGAGPYGFKKPKPSSVNEYRKDREEWSDAAIACLLDAYTEKFTQLNRGNLRGRDWEEVAAAVSERCEKQTKSVEQCKNKVDNLKKRYKLERHRMSNGGISASHWPWFKKMEEIVGNSLPMKAATDEEKSAGSSGTPARQSKR